MAILKPLTCFIAFVSKHYIYQDIGKGYQFQVWTFLKLNIMILLFGTFPITDEIFSHNSNLPDVTYYRVLHFLFCKLPQYFHYQNLFMVKESSSPYFLNSNSYIKELRMLVFLKNVLHMPGSNSTCSGLPVKQTTKSKIIIFFNYTINISLK